MSDTTVHTMHEGKTEEPQEKMKNSRRLISSILVCLGPFTQGVMYTWNSYGIPHLISVYDANNTEFILTYVSSSHSLGCTAGAICTGLLVTTAPLHVLIPSLSFLTAVAWSVTTTVSNITIITTAKFCVGFLTVLECAYVPLYILHSQDLPSQIFMILSLTGFHHKELFTDSFFCRFSGRIIFLFINICFWCRAITITSTFCCGVG